MKRFSTVCVTYPLSVMYVCQYGTAFSIWHAPKGVWVWRPLGGGGDALSVCARFKKGWKRMWMRCTCVVSPLETPAPELSCGTFHKFRLSELTGAWCHTSLINCIIAPKWRETVVPLQTGSGCQLSRRLSENTVGNKLLNFIVSILTSENLISVKWNHQTAMVCRH